MALTALQRQDLCYAAFRDVHLWLDKDPESEVSRHNADGAWQKLLDSGMTPENAPDGLVYAVAFINLVAIYKDIGEGAQPGQQIPTEPSLAWAIAVHTTLLGRRMGITMGLVEVQDRKEGS